MIFWYDIFMFRAFIPIILLTISNVFMTFAWYGHLKYKNAALWSVVLVSWLIAFLEYCFQVPANRIGHQYFDAAQLKTMQEVITLSVFCVFSVLYLKEELKWNYIVGFLFILLFLHKYNPIMQIFLDLSTIVHMFIHIDELLFNIFA